MASATDPSATGASASSNQASGVADLDDASIEYFSSGQGPAVVLLPGGALSVGYLEGLANELAAAGYRAVRINPRGAGKSVAKSTGSSDDVTYHTLAADVAGVVTTLQLAPVCVAGHAFGNRIARTFAADHPELVSGVVLLAAGGKVPPTPEAGNDLRVIFNPAAAESDVLAAMPTMLGDPTNAQVVWEKLKASRAPAAAGIQAQAAAATPLDDWWAPSGASPYLVVQGLRDLAAPPENGRLLKEELGDRVTMVDLPEAGHLAPVEAPQEVASAMISFL